METIVVQEGQGKDLEELPLDTTHSPLLDNIELPEDTFRMSLDNVSIIGENVTIGDEKRNSSVEQSSTIDAPIMFNTPESLDIPSRLPSNVVEDIVGVQPIAETPKNSEKYKTILSKRPIELKLNKSNDENLFVKPSPMTEVMSPAKMLQFEVDPTSSGTPTMKRAAIDFSLFNKTNLEELFDGNETSDKSFKETSVIVTADTVRHEIGYASSESRGREPSKGGSFRRRGRKSHI